MSLQPLDELFKILKDERVAELLKENEQLRQKSIDGMKLYQINGMHGRLYVLSNKNDANDILKNLLEKESKESCYVKFEYTMTHNSRVWCNYTVKYMLTYHPVEKSCYYACDKMDYKID